MPTHRVALFLKSVLFTKVLMKLPKKFKLGMLLLAYAFSCANGTGDRDSCEFGQLVRSFAGAPDG